MLQVYSELLPHIKTTARLMGYAITIHGSGVRDLDLVAIPWAEEVCTPSELVDALTESVRGFVLDEEVEWADQVRRNPVLKPHGRMAWSIHLTGSDLYIDLSVMPPLWY